MRTVAEVAGRHGLTPFDYQEAAPGHAVGQAGRERLCLYYRTGAGKTLTALLALAVWGHQRALVITPPATFGTWLKAAAQLGMAVDCMSHAKFRQAGTQVSRTVPVIADEMHLFGGHNGKGWVKLDRLARGLQAPMILASATPNYNDAERVYCIQHILDPLSCKGGYIAFIYANCTTEHNPFAREPNVTGFHNFDSAEEYLAALPGVAFVPDELVWSITDVTYDVARDIDYDSFGYNRRRHRMVASIMEDRHTRNLHGIVGQNGLVLPGPRKLILDLVEQASTPVLIFCARSTIAEAVSRTLDRDNVRHRLVTGDLTTNEKEARINEFRSGYIPVLVGTATLATGTDGLDKVCDRLIIVDDTDDDAQRRQLVGRILPRGEDSDASKKQVYRLLQLTL